MMIKIVGISLLSFTLLSIGWRLFSYKICPSWLSWLIKMDNPFTKINRAANIVKNADIKEGMRVLDAGCGPGRVTSLVAQKVGLRGTVFAMDIQEKMLDEARKKILSENFRNVEFIRAGLGENKLWDSHFDRVLLVTVLGEIQDQKTALKEIYHSLRSGGILSITELIFDPHFQKQKKVLKLAEEAGFSCIKRFGSKIAYTLNFKKNI